MLKYFVDCFANNTSCLNDFVVPNAIHVTKLILALSNLTINTIFLVLLFQKRSTLKWKRYWFVVNLSVSDITVGIILISLAIISLINTSNNAMVLFLKALIIGPLIINVLSYSGGLWLQYHAVRRPLQYKTRLSTSELKFIIFLIWFTVYLYTAIKWIIVYHFPDTLKAISVVQFSFMVLVFFTNIFVYIYIMRVAVVQKNLHRTSVELKMSDKNQISCRKTSNASYKNKVSFGNKYYFAVTLGFSLCLLFVAILPLGVYWYMEIMRGRIMLLSNDLVKEIVFICYYSRTVLDPLIHLYREPKLLFLSRK